MAEEQNEYGLPVGKGEKRRSARLLPRFYRTEPNKKILQATIDQLTQSGTVNRINGFIGRQNAKAVTGNDVFINAATKNRQDYQLEPSLVAKDDLGNVSFFKDYLDYINTVDVLGGVNTNHQRLNKQEFYSWNPHIDWDKFVNFQQYYWLPYGPATVEIFGQQQAITSTYTVELSDEGDNRAFLFTPNGLTRNPTLRLYRGQTYRFEINTPGEPFSIKTQRDAGTLYRYTKNVSASAVQNGVIEFTVPEDAPNVLYYVSENSVDTGGAWQVFDIEENTAIDVENEIIGKKTYTLPNGLALSNGMKVNFGGQVSPEKYAKGNWYVDGVGDKITLVSELSLENVTTYSETFEVLFDDSGFDTLPFSDATAFAAEKDYITINRTSVDGNPWSRYNRWFHQDVIIKSAEAAGVQPVLNQDQRAVRPIIEFESNIKLYNFGTTVKQNVDLVDRYTKDVFSTIEGSLGYNVDEVPLANGQRVLFLADTDVLVRNKIFQVEFIRVQEPGQNPRRQIHLVEIEDTAPGINETVLVKLGAENQGKMFWFDGTAWKESQLKNKVNQSPLFDLFDINGVSLTDESVYSGSTFAGNKLFSYKEGLGVNDSVLGFPLSYRNINNVGDIVFTFDLLQNQFFFKEGVDVITQSTDSKFLKKITGPESGRFINGWTKNVLDNVQPIVRIYKDSDKVNDFAVDVYDDVSNLSDLKVKVYINGKRLSASQFSVNDGPVYKTVKLNSDITVNDVVTLKCYSTQKKNDNGHYELPINLQNNPLNDNVNNFTLGEVIDHVDSIVDNLETFNGAFPGTSNLRDLGNTVPYGTRFVQHSGSLNLGTYFLTSKNANVLRAVEQARDEYGKFKRNFVTVSTKASDDLPIKEFVDKILADINKDKPNQTPYYFSDMIGFGASVKTDYEVVDRRIKTYPLSEPYSLDQLTNKSVNVYLNQTQLLYDKDYTFNSAGFVVISAELEDGDIVTVYEYESTDGCCIPPTPTSLGLWPKFEPKKYLDTTLVTPQNVLQGHDGSIILAYNDYRDDLILELEKRIFNNIKVNYDASVIDIFDFIPGYNRPTEYSLKEFNTILAPSFYQWTPLVNRDFTKPLSYDLNNPFTYNYGSSTAPDGSPIPGYWRGIYRWMFDTDRINITPWECLGFSVEPSWWQNTYGPAPYTSDNLILWQDLKEGIIREPGKPVTRNPKFARPILENLPVDAHGDLVSPFDANLAQGFFIAQLGNDFVFGDQNSVETAWRRSSFYPFSVLLAMILMKPNKVIGSYIDRSRVTRNASDQIVYKDTGLRLRLKDIAVPSVPSDTERVMTAGLINYVVDYILSDNLRSLTEFKNDLQSLTNQLSHRLGGFTSKEKFNLILDSKSPTATAGVFVPSENYTVFLNTSSPVKKLNYSGVVITKVLNRYSSGYEVKGYSQKTPFFYYYPWTRSGNVINVGGISESYIEWTPGQIYTVGNIVRYTNSFFRVKTTHTAQPNFDNSLMQKLPALPITGGREAVLRNRWDRTPTVVNYGTTFRTIQEVVDFLQGYGEYLKDQGFVFDSYNTDLRSIASWETSVKEFLFWTTQNWSPGEDKFVDWLPDTEFKEGEIVLYNGDYYRSRATHITTNLFDNNFYSSLASLSQEGASAIALSPSALGLSMNLEFTVVDDLRDSFNEYEIFRADGQKFDQDFLNYTREDNTFAFSPRVDGVGIYGAGFYLVQKEHVLLIDNITQFNDTIYDLEAGYRQERIRVAGYKTTDWYGGFDIPGFIFDTAYVREWDQWTDYNLGDTVRYKEFYYSAKSFIAGTIEFNDSDWVRLDQKPESRLLPNWDYKADQFTDFYDLDSDNFDAGQQRVAQHLIGYQKRQYLENIIKNDVSEYKFYQGMISEKGSSNALNKLFDVLSAVEQESIDFNEEWAVRVGQYGGSEAFEEIEISLDETLFKTNPQAFEFVNSVDNTIVDFVIRQSPADIYVKPKEFSVDVWPIQNKTRDFLRTPGYVRYDQVDVNIDSLTDILTSDISTFTDGDYVWCAFQERDWNVFRFTAAEFFPRDIEYSNGVLKIQCDKIPTVEKGDIIGIINSDAIAGFHTVDNVVLNTIFINKVIPNWRNPFQDSAQVLFYKFVPQRFDTIDNAVLPKFVKPDEYIWTDSIDNGKSGVWINNLVYSRKKLTNPLLGNNAKFGKALAVSKQGQLMAVSTDTGQIVVYKKANNTVGWTRQQSLSLPLPFESLTGYGDVLSLSDDDKWLAVGLPKAGLLKTTYTGDYDNTGSTTYNVNDIVKVGTTYWKANKTIAGDGSSITFTSENWDPAYLIELDIDNGTASTLTNQGLILLYSKDDTGEFTFETAFVSPDPLNAEFFGSKIKFAKSSNGYTMAVSSPGYNVNQGRVYLFDYNTVDSRWQMSHDSRYRGIYNSAVEYNVDDIVFYDFKLYQARVQQEGIAPTSSSNNWQRVSDKNVFGYFPQQIVTADADADLDYLPLPGDESTVIDGLGDSTTQPAQTVEAVRQGDQFGYDFDFSEDGTYLIISAPASDQFIYDNFRGLYRENQTYLVNDVVLYSNTYYKCLIDFNGAPAGAFNSAKWQLLASSLELNNGKVFVYKKDEDSYDLVQTLAKTNVDFLNAERFGESVTIASNASMLAVGSLLADDTKTDQGLVRVFNLATQYELDQIVKNRNPETVEGFGYQIKFINDNKSLAVLSKLGDGFTTTTFDRSATTFDRTTTKIKDINVDSGRIDIYDKYESKFVFAEALPVESTALDSYAFAFAAGNNVVVTSAINAINSNVRNGSVFTYTKPNNKFSWTVEQQESEKIDVSKIKKAFLYNKKTNELLTYLDVIDPIQGKISGVADKELKYKTYYDPATYSVGTAEVTIDDGMAWLDQQVGMLWWDLSRAKFLDSYTGDIVYKNSTWNTLYESGTIDVYEWVESKLTPDQWDAQADTEEGLVNGVSGTSLYGNSVYSIKRKYDTIAKSFRNTYYFWVKNKTVIPNVPGRSISASDVASLIRDPKGQGIKYLQFTDTNSFSLVNAKNNLANSDTVLTVQYWIADQSKLNIHTDWKIISENDNTVIPSNIERKWIDSLVGVDENNKLVPDIDLPPKQRYGAEFKPRQSMFVNRLEALKEFVERLNGELARLLIVDSADLTDFNSIDAAPSVITGLYDYVVDADNEIRLINTGAYRPASLRPVVVDGRVIRVVIDNPGSGYIYAPYLTISGSGFDARIRTILDPVTGSITGVDIINQGYGYNEYTTTASIRDLSILVRSDSNAIGRWTIYAFNINNNTWNRTKTQGYDVANFWNYINWYDVGYNQFSKIDFIVDSTYQLYTLESNIGQLVKVKNVGSSGWMLLEKFANIRSIDYTQSYRVVGRQNGTIQLSNRFYQFVDTNLGYDGPLFDADTYDNSGSVELRIILTALKDKVLIDDLRPIYLKLFFASVRYALAEQTFVDWAFKTSFVKAMHNVGELKQKVTYNNDNLVDFESYIAEVKPYRTKIREYVSSYNALDNTQSVVTDFDVPPVTRGLRVEPLISTIENGNIVVNEPEINEYPWKHWIDNVGFKVDEIRLVDGGAGYINRPVVNIIGDAVVPATARAYISNGRVTKIELLTKGSGYLTAPRIEISGGLSQLGTAAKAVAIIKNDLVRSNLIKIKFDRITRNFFITDLNATETFVGTGSRLQFPLKWSPDTKTGNTVVTVENQEALRDTYAISTRTTTTRGYTAYSGLITFDSPPVAGEEIVITYVKDFNYLSAADRINYYYNPETGQIGKDMAQLMTGVDYGGVNIIGLDFEASSGWDELPWFSDVWDSFDPTYDDYIVTAGDSAFEFKLPYVPTLGQQLNVYVNGVRIDDPYFNVYDGVTVQPNGRLIAPPTAKMQTFVGNGVTDTVVLPNLSDDPALDINDGDQIIFRKSTSDGSQSPSNLDYDTSLSGGDLAYSTATGLAADDIIVDGDGFVTTTSSPATEEVVPGQIMDTVAIKVYHRPTTGSAKIISKNYVADGVETLFGMEQFPNTQNALVVKVADQILTLGTDYTVDYDTQSVRLTTAPANKTIVNVSSFGYNGTDILDLDYFVGDGSTIEFITNATWSDTATSLVVVSGVLQDYVLFRTDSTYESTNKVGIRFGAAPVENAVVNYLISRSGERTFSLSTKETVQGDGTTAVFPLTGIVAIKEPLEANVIVRNINSNQILSAPNNTYYTLSNNNLRYKIPTTKFEADTYETNDFKVYLDGVELSLMLDYTLDLLAGEIVLNISRYVDNARMILSILPTADYRITTDSTVNVINFATPPTDGHVIEIMSMYNHDVLDIERSDYTVEATTSLVQDTVEYYEYNQVVGGTIPLQREVLSDDYVWVVKNNTLLTQSIDYKLSLNKKEIKLAEQTVVGDTFSVITFATNIVKPGYGFMQFKDMLNRDHYKRINASKSTILLEPLNYYDNQIVVENGQVLTEPNRSKNLPGIIYVNGERIEFFVKDNNILSQIRRGTLGTGTPVVHVVGSDILDISITETIPYTDDLIVDTFVYDGSTSLIPTQYTPNPTFGTIDDGSSEYTEWRRTTIPEQFGQCDEVEVFVGGYNIKGIWESATDYSVGEIIVYGTYMFRCVSSHRSNDSFTQDRAKWDYFVGTQRLKKIPYSVYNNELHPESPEGDANFEADFSVDGTTSAVRLTTELAAGTKVVVVKKVGRIWNDPGKSLVESDNKVANFLKNTSTLFPR
jgi:hypothetical protein